MGAVLFLSTRGSLFLAALCVLLAMLLTHIHTGFHTCIIIILRYLCPCSRVPPTCTQVRGNEMQHTLIDTCKHMTHSLSEYMYIGGERQNFTTDMLESTNSQTQVVLQWFQIDTESRDCVKQQNMHDTTTFESSALGLLPGSTTLYQPPSASIRATSAHADLSPPTMHALGPNAKSRPVKLERMVCTYRRTHEYSIC